MGQGRRGRSYHAIAEANLRAVCFASEAGTSTEDLNTTEAPETAETTSSPEAGTSTEESAETLNTTEAQETAETTSSPGFGETGTIAIVVFCSLLLLANLICLLLFCCRRWILSVTFKRDINNDYGLYPESGDVVMEAVDQNDENEQQAAGGEDQAMGRQVYE